MVFFLLFLFSIFPKLAFAESIDSISIDPLLDISYFDNYTVNANISNYSSSSPVSLELSAINGDGGSYWEFYADGTPYEENFSFDMVYSSDTNWTKTTIRPDYIYPEIFLPQKK